MTPPSAAVPASASEPIPGPVAALPSNDMPTYVYHCSKCGHQFEAQAAWSENLQLLPQPNCVSCGSLDVQRLVSPPAAIIFKGKGWAKNGYDK